MAGLTIGVSVTNGFARFDYGSILPAMREDLRWNYAEVGWLNTANALGYVVGALAILTLVGRFHASQLFGLGVWTPALALMATGFHEALWAQTLGRVVVGLFSAMSFVTEGAPLPPPSFPATSAAPR